jgi:UPF0716 protein FxsA
MKFGLFLLLAAIPLIEIALLVKVGQWLGLWPTLGLVVATAFAGTYVLHRQGFAVMQRTMETMAAGKPPVGPVVDGAFLMMAGLLLIAPGLITDGLGLLLLIPPLRHRLAAWGVRLVLRSAVVRRSTFSTGRSEQPWSEQPWPGEPPRPEAGARPGPATPAGPVIEGEFERVEERTVDARRRQQSTGTGPAADERR